MPPTVQSNAPRYFRTLCSWHVGLVALLAWSLFTIPLPAQSVVVARKPPPLRLLSHDRHYELRTLYVEDPRLPRLSETQRTALYAKITRLLSDWLGYTVKLREVDARGLAAQFAKSEQIFAQRTGDIRETDFDPFGGQGATMLGQVIARALRARPLPMIEGYLKSGPLSSQAEAVEVARARFLNRLNDLRAIPTESGQPFYDPAQSRFSSFGHWWLLMEEIQEADFVLTNSMIVGADQQMPIYVIARGGLTTGLTINNHRSPYQAATMVGLMPFLSDSPLFLRERGRIPEEERLDVIATFCLHEMGHFFGRFAEHYDHPNCAHVAPTGLNYYEWHKSVRGQGPCPLVHKITERF